MKLLKQKLNQLEEEKPKTKLKIYKKNQKKV